MGLFDMFKKKPQEDSVGVTDLRLRDLRVGYYVDYYLKTWEVKAANRYDWDGEESLEWQLASPGTTFYLQMDEDDEVSWSMSKAIAFSDLGSEIRKAIIEQGDPPEQITFGSDTYFMDEVAGGHFYANGQTNPEARPQEMISWSYSDADGEKYLTIEQWGEQEFKAYLGWPVEEFQFSNILPTE